MTDRSPPVHAPTSSSARPDSLNDNSSSTQNLHDTPHQNTHEKQPQQQPQQQQQQEQQQQVQATPVERTSPEQTLKMTDSSQQHQPSISEPALAETSKKKSRLQWDEDNLISNAQEMERAGPRMKIDEPKTPYVQGSETGSSTSGSAHQSPPESPSFIPGERLVGFRSLEASMRRSSGGGASSDGASSAGSAGRSVQISDDFTHSSGGSSPKSKEIFAARRKAHYRNEAARLGKHPLGMGPPSDDDHDHHRNDQPDADPDSAITAGINGHHHVQPIANGQSVDVGSTSVRDRLAMLNNHRDDAEQSHDDPDNDD